MATGLGLRAVLAIAAGRITRRAVLLLRPGGATAIPGRVVERIDPSLLGRILAQPRVVAVSGSSGKGTTTKMVVAILEAHGVDLFTNKYAGNITRGMLSELLRVVDWRGRFPHEYAVMEMDEAYGALATEAAGAEVTVLLNVMVDQLHRWQEPDRVAGYLERMARATTGTVVVNRDDPQLRRVAARLSGADAAELRFFSVAPEIAAGFPHGLGSAPAYGPEGELPAGRGESRVVAFEQDAASIELSDGATVAVRLPSSGIHLAVDSAAALEAARAVLGDRFDAELAARALSEAPAVFARGETARVRGEVARFALMKSPMTMQLNIDALDPEVEQLAIIAGKDVPDPSMLWAVDWSALRRVDVVGGRQAAELASRLAYDGVEVGRVEEDVETAVDAFFALPAPAHGVKNVLFTAEGMRRTRRHLKLYEADTEKLA